MDCVHWEEMKHGGTEGTESLFLDEVDGIVFDVGDRVLASCFFGKTNSKNLRELRYSVFPALLRFEFGPCFNFFRIRADCVDGEVGQC